VEIVSTGSLNNDDVSLLLEYQGTSGSSVASFVSSLPANVLTAGSALPSSSATWVGGVVETWNPNDKSAAVTLSNGNLTATSSSTNTGVRATYGFSTGKIYYEILPTSLAGYAGFARDTTVFTGTIAAVMIATSSGWIQVNGSSVLNIGGISSIGIAIDLTANLIWFRSLPAGNWNGNATYNPATGTGGVNISAIVGGPLYPALSVLQNGDNLTANFGASAFSGSMPTGFVSPNTALVLTAQKLQVPFVPLVAGRVRGLIRLGKFSTIAWVNPQITIT
jgi:hypothetical protein